jgi:hypothetical protein
MFVDINIVLIGEPDDIHARRIDRFVIYLRQLQAIPQSQGTAPPKLENTSLPKNSHGQLLHALPRSFLEQKAWSTAHGVMLALGECSQGFDMASLFSVYIA